MSEQFVQIATISGSFEAEILRSMLEANSIPVLLSGESAGKAIGISIGPLGDIDLLVPASYAESARSMLDDYYSAGSE